MLHYKVIHSVISCSAANQGFPFVGAPTRWEGPDLRCGHFLVKTHVKTKELGYFGGGEVLPAPPGSTNASAPNLHGVVLVSVVRSTKLFA